MYSGVPGVKGSFPDSKETKQWERPGSRKSARSDCPNNSHNNSYAEVALVWQDSINRQKHNKEILRSNSTRHSWFFGPDTYSKIGSINNFKPKDLVLEN